MAEELKCRENLYPITGTIYDKSVRTVPDTKGKNGGNPYEFHSLILEVKRTHKEKIYTTFPQFDAGFGVSFDPWEIGDRVIVTFSVDGKKIGDWHKTSLKAHYLQHADVTKDQGMKDVSGASPQERRRAERAEKDIFENAGNPLADDEESDPPF